MALTTNPDQYKVIGTSPVRHDGVDKVTGRAKYGADVQMTGLLHGKILRSPHSHARILSIDTSKAEALPGVKSVATAQDFAIVDDNTVLDFSETRGTVRMVAENVLASKKVLYKGHAIAAVAAINAHIAEEALDLIDVQYEVLTPVLDVQEAMKEDAPLILENITTSFRIERFGPGEDTGRLSNVADHLQWHRGDLEQGFKDATVIVEREFHTKMVHQGYIEPQTSTGFWGADGRVTIWTSTQGTFLSLIHI